LNFFFIVKNYILPDVTKTMGLEKVVEINDEVIEYLINNLLWVPVYLQLPPSFT